MMEVDHALCTGKWPNCNTLAQVLEVDPRTIRPDE
jgi:hypothetical protein